MADSQDNPLDKLKWYFFFIAVAIAAVIFLTLFTSLFEQQGPVEAMDYVWLLIAGLILAALIALIARLTRVSQSIDENGTRLERLTSSLEKMRAGISQINDSSHVSDTAKAIAYRETDRQLLRETVYDKLHQQEFDTAYQIIDEIQTHAQYEKLAEQLRREVDSYRDATDQERINRITSYIEKLLDQNEWARASAQIERLAKIAPNSDKVQKMRQMLVDKKQERKKILLSAWDDAVKRQATDRSLEILRELDQYLTPSEGLALQEAARDVFRNKLHNLGVQFSIAVSGRQWEKALETGQQIIRDFPNSKMAQEIRESWDGLEQKMNQQKQNSG